MPPYFWLLFLCASGRCFAKEAKQHAENEDSEPEDAKHGKQVVKPARRQFHGIISGSYVTGDETVVKQSSSLANTDDSSPYEYYDTTVETMPTEDAVSSTILTSSTGFPVPVSMKMTTSLTPAWTTIKRDSAGRWDDNLEDNLTAEAWAELPNREELERDEKQVKARWWWNLEQRLNPEYEERILPYGIRNAGTLIRGCYQIGTTYFAARGDLREYYKLRYMYQNELEYELGYVVHEIVHKYTVLLEMYHIVQYRYYNHSKFSDYMTSSAMLYMYTNILDISHQIVHLCNALHEIEKKYEYVEKIFSQSNMQDEFIKNKNYLVSGEGFKGDFIKEQEYAKQKRMQKRKKIRKDHKKIFQSGMYSSTKRTRRPRSYGHFPHHYGWSIEYW